MTAKNLLQTILLLIGVIGFYAAAAALNNIPLIVAVFIGFVLWILYFVLVVRDDRRKKQAPAIWVIQNGRYVAADGSGRTRPIEKRPESQPIFDQDGDAQE